MEQSNYPRPHLKPRQPWWVALTLVGLGRRNAVLACGWVAVLLAGVALAAGAFYPRAFAGVIFLLAAPPYFLTVRWMDAQSAW